MSPHPGKSVPKSHPSWAREDTIWIKEVLLCRVVCKLTFPWKRNRQDIGKFMNEDSAVWQDAGPLIPGGSQNSQAEMSLNLSNLAWLPHKAHKHLSSMWAVMWKGLGSTNPEDVPHFQGLMSQKAVKSSFKRFLRCLWQKTGSQHQPLHLERNLLTAQIQNC